MKIVAVFHGEKARYAEGDLPEVAANPPMTEKGCEQIRQLIPALAEHGPFDALYCGRTRRVTDTASILSLALDLEFDAVRGLGQHANGGDGQPTVYYPGCERENFVRWQEMAIQAVNYHMNGSENVLIASSRPIIGGLVAYSQNVTDEEGIAAVVRDKELTKKGFVVFEVTFSMFGPRFEVIDD